MPIVKVMDMTGKEVGEITLSDVIFGADVNGAVLHAAVRTYLMNQRQGTQSTLTRTEVSGGGKKPWRQKGTGRARQGSTRAPQWTHGGVALGPKPRDYRLSMNKKTRKVALYSALSAKVAEGNLIVVDDIKTAEFKTKTMVNMINALGGARKPLIVLPEVDTMVVKSCDNIPGAKTTLAHTVNVYDVLNADKFIASRAAIEKLQEVFA
ncbi:MAG: 50S ribosomal protein L4 [Clostridia bacterium]|nr:50S ribosomal protein L4 [Clostridia bacterium]